MAERQRRQAAPRAQGRTHARSVRRAPLTRTDRRGDRAHRGRGRAHSIHRARDGSRRRLVNVGLRVADRVARAGGPRAGLAAYRMLAGKTDDAEVRGQALLAALRCAVAIEDFTAFSDIVEQWEFVSAG